LGTLALPCLICGGSGRRSHKLKKLCTLCEGTGLRLGSLALPCPGCGGWGYTE
jgi:DnaJ-class molecular chaperone